MSGRRQYLLDTNVLSETRKQKANQQVIAFLAAADASALYTSVLVLGELRKGIALKKRTDPGMARKLSSWADNLEDSFADRVLSVDANVARIWGELSASRTRPVIDTLLAATAIAYNLTLVTRNTADVADLAADLLNPWRQ